jgi:uncharacterized protein YuzE
MKIEGHYDETADIAWLRLEGHEPATVVAGNRVRLARGRLALSALVGLEFWRASKTLSRDLLGMLPSPPTDVTS